jgi:DNA-directed RNA polymerase specialized sigma24 family protein
VHLKRGTKRSPSFLLNSVDRLGRQIGPAVFAAAQEIGPTAVRHAERLLGDPALAISLFEETAATVTETLQENAARGKPVVDDLHGYLFLAFMRRVRRGKRTELVFEDADERVWEKRARYTDGSATERSVFMREVLATCDTVTKNIILRRLEGFSWKEIGRQCGVSSHAARQRFSATLQRLRKAFRGKGQTK